MRAWMLLCLMLISIMALPGLALAQSKHPRAFQIEKLLQSDLEQSLKLLLGQEPFSVSIMVDPLRRNPANSERSSLPLLEIRDEMADEWDDPDRMDYELLARVNRISVTVTVSDLLAKPQVEEVKSLIKKRIPFVEGRDLVQVETKDFQIAQSQSSSYKWLAIVGGLMLLTLGVIHLLVNLLATTRLSKAIKGIKVDVNSAGGGPSAPTAAMSHNASGKRENSRLSGGDLQLHDTIKMTELVQDLVTTLESKKAFPVLEDLLLLEDEIKKNPSSVGALINSFPDHLREAVFSYSYSQDWFKVLFDGGILDAKSFEIMNRMVKHSRHSETYLQQTLLMRCWIAQDSLSGFLRSIDQEDSITILRMLPRGLAVSLGREVIPGRWATLLDKNDNTLAPKMLPELRIHQYIKQLNEIRPLRDSTVFESYKKDLELIDYLKNLDPVVEKEIYLAAGENSTLWTLRSPFFPVIEASEEELKGFVSQISIEDWAHALFNVPKTSRYNIERCFTDRQKFMLVDLLKKLDRSGGDMDRMSISRGTIAGLWMSYAKEHLNSENSEIQPDTNKTSDPMAA